MNTARRRCALIAAAALALGACGVTSDPQAKEIPVNQLPFGLADTTTSSTAPPPPPPTTTTTTVVATTVAPTTTAPSFSQTVYFVAPGGRLRAVDRSTTERPSISAALGLLAKGPSGTDPAGLSTIVAPGVVDDVRVVGGVAVAAVGANYAALDPISQLLATAQLVLALTELPGIGRVSLEAGGAPIPLWLLDGSQSEQSAAADDYRALVDS